MAPFTRKLVTCMHCGEEFICGDAIDRTCPTCKQKGHTSQVACPVCRLEDEKAVVRVRLVASGKFSEQQIDEIMQAMGYE